MSTSSDAAPDVIWPCNDLQHVSHVKLVELGLTRLTYNTSKRAGRFTNLRAQAGRTVATRWKQLRSKSPATCSSLLSVIDFLSAVGDIARMMAPQCALQPDVFAPTTGSDGVHVFPPNCMIRLELKFEYDHRNGTMRGTIHARGPSRPRIRRPDSIAPPPCRTGLTCKESPRDSWRRSRWE